jgi:hypothetical protein
MVTGLSGQPQYIKDIMDVMILFHIHYFFCEVRPDGTRKYFMLIKVILPKPL